MSEEALLCNIPGRKTPDELRLFYEQEQEIPSDSLDLYLTETRMETRITNALEAYNILTVRDLLNCSRERIMRINGFNVRTLEKIYEVLAEIGFTRRQY